MNGNTQNNKAGLIAVCGAIAVVGGWSVYRSQASGAGITFQEAPKATTEVKQPQPQTPEPPPSKIPDAPVEKETTETPDKTEKPAVPAPAPEIVVHITGAVKKPGVYRLPDGSRGKDAVEKAGGILKGANAAALNLAAKLEDGSQLYIPTQKQEPQSPAEKEYLAGNTPIVVPEKPAESASPKSSSVPKPDKSAALSHSGGSRSGSNKLTDPSQGMVNINTAGAEELQRLPGIGPAMAARIIAYRQEFGKFQTPDDLNQVSGIGDKKLAKMKPFVKVK